MAEENPQNQNSEGGEGKYGVYSHIINNIVFEDDIRQHLLKVGATDIIERSDKLLKMFRALPLPIVEDLKTLPLHEIKSKYGLEGERVDSGFLVTELHKKAFGKE